MLHFTSSDSVGSRMILFSNWHCVYRYMVQFYFYSGAAPVSPLAARPVPPEAHHDVNQRKNLACKYT